jgi:hypothetical protein
MGQSRTIVDTTSRSEARAYAQSIVVEDLPGLVSLGFLRHPKRLGVGELIVSVGAFKLLLLVQTG